MSRALPTLWKRASWWRFCLLSAITLTLLFLLFPPGAAPDHANSRPAPAADIAFTAPKAAANPAAALGQSSPAGNVVAQVQQVPSKVPAIAQPSSGNAPPAKLSPAPPVPQVAQIAMANANPADALSGIDPRQISKTVHGELSVQGFTVQLPPGEWMQLASGTVKGAHLGEILVLGRIEHKKLLGLVQISALRTVDASKEEFPVLGACAPGGGSEQLFIHSEADVANVTISCWLINHMYTPPLAQWADKSVKMDNFLRMAAGDLAAKGVTYEQDYIDVNFARRESWGFLQVRYGFDPSAEGIASSSAMNYYDSDWAVDHIKRFPDKLAYLQKIEDWGNVHWATFKTGFDDAKKG